MGEQAEQAMRDAPLLAKESEREYWSALRALSLCKEGIAGAYRRLNAMGEQYGIPFLGATILHRGTRGITKVDEYVSRSGVLRGLDAGGRHHNHALLHDALLCAQRYKRAYAKVRRLQTHLLDQAGGKRLAAMAREVGITPALVNAVRVGAYSVQTIQDVLTRMEDGRGVRVPWDDLTLEAVKLMKAVVGLETISTAEPQDEVEQLLVVESRSQGGDHEQAVTRVVCDYWRQTQDVAQQLRDMRSMMMLEHTGAVGEGGGGSVVEKKVEGGWGGGRDDGGDSGDTANHVAAPSPTTRPTTTHDADGVTHGADGVTHDADGVDDDIVCDSTLLELCRIYKLTKPDSGPVERVSRGALTRAIHDRPEVYLCLGHMKDARQAAMSLLKHNGPLSLEDTQLLFGAPHPVPSIPLQIMLNDLSNMAEMFFLFRVSETLAGGVMPVGACWRLLTMLQRHPCILRMHLKLRGTASWGGLDPLTIAQTSLAHVRKSVLRDAYVHLGVIAGSLAGRSSVSIACGSTQVELGDAVAEGGDRPLHALSLEEQVAAIEGTASPQLTKKQQQQQQRHQGSQSHQQQQSNEKKNKKTRGKRKEAEQKQAQTQLGDNDDDDDAPVRGEAQAAMAAAQHVDGVEEPLMGWQDRDQGENEGAGKARDVDGATDAGGGRGRGSDDTPTTAAGGGGPPPPAAAAEDDDDTAAPSTSPSHHTSHNNHERHTRERRAESHAQAQPAENEGGDDDVLMDAPHDFECPLSFAVMKDPVIAMDSITYERVAIEWYIRKCAEEGTPLTSPVTREPMEAVLITNRAHRNTIESWLQRKRGHKTAAARSQR